MQTILILGATGFCGHHTLQYLQHKQDIKVIAACRNPEKLGKNFTGEVRIGDIRDAAYLATLFHEVDVIINAMSWSSLFGHSKQSKALFLDPTETLNQAFFNSEATRLVNISTTSAAAPLAGEDAHHPGIQRRFWPHLNNVIKIENRLKKQATPDKTVVNCRLGIFAGSHYALGLLPILLPRLKTHLVPWVKSGRTTLPIIDGRDIGQALGKAATAKNLSGYESFNFVGPSKPTVKEIIEYLNQSYGYPKPHFSVPFAIAYAFAATMEWLNPIVPWQPLVTRSIIHLLEETNADNQRAFEHLGYQPRYHWQQAIDSQLQEMQTDNHAPMRMAKPIT